MFRGDLKKIATTVGIEPVTTRSQGGNHINYSAETSIRGGLTHLCLASRKKALVNSVDPDETPHDAASHQVLRSLLKGISVRNILNIEINILQIANFEIK